MNILFVSYGELSIPAGALRPVSILRALADAGHQVDVIAPRTDLKEHPHVRILCGADKHVSRHNLRMTIMRATGSGHYDAVHAVDESVLFLSGICSIRKIRLVYDASRCFSGKGGVPPNGLWKLFPGHLNKRERKALQRASAVMVPCQVLSDDLSALEQNGSILLIDDVPAQSLFSSRAADKHKLLQEFDGVTSSIVVCSILPGNQKELKKLLVGVRKVIDVLPQASFFFKGAMVDEAVSMASSLDIQRRCSFFGSGDAEAFLTALDLAHVTLFMPPLEGRYIHNEVYTLLNVPAPMVFVQSPAYDRLLTDQNSIQVLSSSDAIAEGLIRAIQEPLFSLSIATEGQQLIAEQYSLSSFKHKIRMAYHEILNSE